MNNEAQGARKIIHGSTYRMSLADELVVYYM